MFKFFGVMLFILLPLFLVVLAMGRRIEENGERTNRDKAIRDGIKALRLRITNLEILRSFRRERRG